MMDYLAIKTVAGYWFIFWIGLVLICLRDEDGRIINDILRPIKNGGYIALVYTLIIMIMIPISIPFSILYLLRK